MSTLNPTGFALVPLCSLLIAPCTGAQAPVLVKDLNQTQHPNWGASPQRAVLVGNDMYFAATTPDRGTELYLSKNGTAPPVLVKDIVLGTGSSLPTNLTALGTILYFTVTTPSATFQLWKSDGTAKGTMMVASLASTTWSVVALGKQLLLGTATALWISDGTGIGTKVLAGAPAAELAVSGSTVFFRAHSLRSGWELWRTDGTSAGTGIVADIYPGAIGSYPVGLCALGNKVVFCAYDRTLGETYWVSDGTPKGTLILKNTLGKRIPYLFPEFIQVGGKIYFGTAEVTSGYGLWVTDGTPAGTLEVQSTQMIPLSIVPSGQSIFFMVFDPGAHRYELWTSDGTPKGTIPGATVSSNTTMKMIASRGILYFASENLASGMELWKSDGTQAGTSMVLDINPGRAGSWPAEFAKNAAGQILFSAVQQMWLTDGSKAGTRPLGAIKPDPKSTASSRFLSVKDHAGITLLDMEFSRWATDGTSKGTVAISSRRMYEETASASLGGAILFAGDLGSGPALLKTDGTSAGTTVIRTFSTYLPQGMTRMGGYVYFAASTNSFGNELWRSDGTTMGTTLAVDLRPGIHGSGPREFVAAEHRLYFIAGPGIPQLYLSDGTAAGTVMLDASKSKTPWGYPRPLVVVDSRLFFSADWNGRKLFKTDGTVPSTIPIKDQNDVYPEPFGPILATGSLVYFSAKTPKSGVELWRTDGSIAGTYLVKDIHPGTSPSAWHLRGLTMFGGSLFFFADDGQHGLELWKSDGTAKGTVMVKDIRPGAAGLIVRYGDLKIATAGRLLYFDADDGIHGRELWRSDGTAAGTKLVADLIPGIGGSCPRDLTLSGGTLLFTALDESHGRELWKIDPGAHTQTIGAGCAVARAPSLSASIPTLGSMLVVDVQAHGPINVRGVFVLGSILTRPTYLGDGCSLYVDLAQPYLAVPFTPDLAGHWTLKTQVPIQPSLNGVLLPTQAAIGPTVKAPLGLDFSAGLILALRK